jgi:Putative Ig domain/Divergent InlB B-repeat domain
MKSLSLLLAGLALAAFPFSANAAPVNDNFADRYTLLPAFVNVAAISTLGATREAGEPFVLSTSYDQTVWFRWSPATTRVVSLRATNLNSYGTIAVYENHLLDPEAGVETIIDNADAAGVTVTGAWTSDTAVAGFTGADYLHDGNTGKGTKSVRFSPVALVPGEYEIYVRWPAVPNRASVVPIDIQHAAGTKTVTLDQRTDGSNWVRLTTGGPLTLDATASVAIRTTGAVDGYVVVDAVRFVRLPEPTFATLLPLAGKGQGNFGPYSGLDFPVTAGRTYLIALATIESEEAAGLELQTSSADVVTSPLLASGEVGAPFRYEITTNNGGSGFSASALPGGLTLEWHTGLISGTPTEGGSFSVNLSIFENGVYFYRRITLLIETPQPRITSAEQPEATQGQPFTYQITATKRPTRFHVENLPTGLVVDETTGVISGTPLNSGNVTLLVSAENAAGLGASAQVRLTVGPGWPQVSEQVAEILVGEVLAYHIVASNHPTSYAAGNLPTGLTLDPATGVISGTPPAAGKYIILVGATNGYGSRNAFLTLRVLTPAKPKFADRVPVTGRTFTIFSRNVADPAEPGEPVHEGVQGGASIWYTWTAPETGLFRVTMDASYHYLLGIYEGTDLRALHRVLATRDEGLLNPRYLRAVAGHVYQIAVDGANGAVGDFTLKVEALGKNPARLLTVSVNGRGTVSAGFAGTSFRRLGERYTIVAKPAVGWSFVGWSGTVSGDSARLTFTMEEGTELFADFSENVTSFTKGSYLGLITVRNESDKAGTIKVQVGATGAFTAAFTIWGKSYATSGVLDLNGNFTGMVSHGGTDFFAPRLSLSLTPNDPTALLTGSVSNEQLFSATFSASQATYDAAKNPAPQAGRHTWMLVGEGADASAPAGRGYGALNVTLGGAVRWAGLLPDGTPATTGGKIADDQRWRIFLTANGGRDRVTGEAVFDPTSTEDFSGDLWWVKRARRAAAFPDGFSIYLPLLGGRYAVPPPGTSALIFTGDEGVAVVDLDEGDFFQAGSSVSALVLPGDRFVAAEAPEFSLAVTRETGFFRGKMRNPATGRVTGFGGVILQKSSEGHGSMRMGRQTLPVQVRF